MGDLFTIIVVIAIASIIFLVWKAHQEDIKNQEKEEDDEENKKHDSTIKIETPNNEENQEKEEDDEENIKEKKQLLMLGLSSKPDTVEKFDEAYRAKRREYRRKGIDITDLNSAYNDLRKKIYE